MGENREYGVFGKCFLLVLLFHGIGYKINYAVDTYYTFGRGFDFAAKDMLFRNGRPVIALIYKIFAIIRLKNENTYYCSFAMAVVCLTVAIYLYQSEFKIYIANDNLRIILTFLTISNTYIIEYFMFLEKGGFMLGILFNVIAVHYFLKYCDDPQPRYVTTSLIMVLLGIMTYQSLAGLSFVLALPIIFRKSDDKKIYTKNIFLISAIYMISALICLISFHTVFDNDRITSGSLLHNGKTALKLLVGSYISTYSIMPKYTYISLFAMVIMFTLIRIIGIENSSERIMAFWNALILLLSLNVLSVASVFAGASWGCPRILYLSMTGVGIFIINDFINHGELIVSKNRINKLVIPFIVFMLLVFNYRGFTKIYRDKYILNATDEMRCYQIGQAIKKYEIETGNKITQITFYRDLNPQAPFYPGLFDDGDLVHSGFLEYDSQLYMINYYLGTNYTHGFPDIGYLELFWHLDWTTFSDDQMVFDKDTLHYVVY